VNVVAESWVLGCIKTADAWLLGLGRGFGGSSLIAIAVGVGDTQQTIATGLISCTIEVTSMPGWVVEHMIVSISCHVHGEEEDAGNNLAEVSVSNYNISLKYRHLTSGSHHPGSFQAGSLFQ
jgi:hypothetical protein